MGRNIIIGIIAVLLLMWLFTRMQISRYQMYIDEANNRNFILDTTTGKRWTFYNIQESVKDDKTILKDNYVLQELPN